MADLITLDYLKSLIASDSTTSDAVWGKLITAASAAFVSRTNRNTIAAQSFTETFSGDGSDELIVRNAPIISIQSLSIGGRAQALYTGSGFGYVLADDGYTVEMMNAAFDVGRRNVVIAYTAGYSVIPADIQEAVAEMCIWKKAKIPRLDLTSQTLQGMETISYSQADIPPNAKATILQYKTIFARRPR